MGKKVQDLVKGIVITGTAVGGASVFSNMGLAYAHEIETTGEEVVYDSAPEAAQEAPAETASQEPTVTAEVTPEAPAAAPEAEVTPEAPAAAPEAEVTPEAPAAAPEAEVTPEAPAAPEAQEAAPEVQAAAPEVQTLQAAPALMAAPAPKAAPALMAAPAPKAAPTLMAAPAPKAAPESAAQAAPAAEPEAEATAAGLTNGTETDASLSDTAEPATVYTEEQISESGASLSTVESELSSTSEQLSTSASEAESEYESYSETMTTTSENYESKNYNIAKLDKLEDDVKTAQSLEIAKRETLAAANKSLDNEYFEKICRPLAITMIKYNLVIDGKADPNFIDSAQIKYYTPDGYDKKHFCTIYLGTDGQVHEEYYDYVTANARGESLFRWSELSEEDVAAGITIPRNISIENYSPYVSGINIVEKFVQDNGIRENGKLFSYTFTGDDGTVKTFKITRQSYSMEADENGHYKGEYYYGYAFMNSQMDERAELASQMFSLSGAIASTGSEVKGYQSMVDEYVARSNELDSAWSEYIANSTKTAESLSNSTSTSERVASEQASTAASELASTAKAESETAASISASESASVASSESTSTSTSVSTSTSTSSSVSASESASVASSQSGSTSASTSASESASASTSVSASEAIEGSESITISNAATEYISDAAGRVDTNVAAGNSYRQAAVITPIDNDARVPLAVLDQEILDDDIVDAPANVDVITGIDDDQVARYGELGPNGCAGASLPIIGGLTGLFVAAKRRKESKEE